MEYGFYAAQVVLLQPINKNIAVYCVYLSSETATMHNKSLY